MAGRSISRILVLCTGNSCRSQMMEGYLNQFGKGHLEASSAGIESHGLNSKAVKVMAEDGVDISSHTSDTIDKYIDQSFDAVVTVCDHAKENCPVLPGHKNSIHQSFEDPAKAKGNEKEILEQFRQVRDQIKQFAARLVVLCQRLNGG